MARTKGAVRQHRRETHTPFQEKKLFEYLYNYGPHTSDDLAEYMSLGRERCLVILNGMLQQGLVKRLKLGRPPIYHWILAEDAE